MKYVFLMLVTLSTVVGCANPEPLGYHQNLVKQQQIYNPNATLENLEVIPEGNGEKMEGVYSTYTGKKGESLQSANSQVLTGFAN
ncbi:hypothetical protein [Vibrio ziniensis]|uniref:Uncharacterized protein n=1 Tax=Vibrio ziniensis TaxID=2711221 RepID=A0A6G7CFV6_9VIBR|nr:hypothetical protein [Vibrio ziniensis]QIH40974.1 hypothetical protein G5S32_02785 [Vibrio ziniensis]